MGQAQELKILKDLVVNCRRCPRLVHYRETVPAKANYIHESYWRRPVPGFGDSNAWLMIVGLAPAPHGGNRTGRPFTGDLSGQFLVRCLFHQGFANQPLSENAQDGLKLIGCYMTAAVKCVPPHHKPSRKEFLNCSSYLHAELSIQKKVTHILALGKLAFDGYLLYLRTQGIKTSGIPFKHGACYRFQGVPTLYVSYHPTPRNTNTGTLTVKMFENLLKRIRHDQDQN